MSAMDILKLMMALPDDSAEGSASDELGKLDDLLTEAGIPFENFGMQICYFGPEGRPKPGQGLGAVCSVIANGCGSSEGLLEIRGLMTHDIALGHLTAEDVFARIRAHYEGQTAFCDGSQEDSVI